MISIDIDINNSLDACQCNKERTNVISVVKLMLNQLWGARHDEKSLQIEHNLKVLRKESVKLLNPFFYAYVVIKRVPERSSTNAILFSFIYPQFFIFWFPFRESRNNFNINFLCARIFMLKYHRTCLVIYFPLTGIPSIQKTFREFIFAGGNCW